MKQLERKYEPVDPRAQKRDRRRREVAEGGMADEFEALFSMRDHTTRDAQERRDRTNQLQKSDAQKDTAKGFER